MDTLQKVWGLFIHLFKRPFLRLKSFTDTREADSPLIKCQNSKLVLSMNTHCKQNCTHDTPPPFSLYISCISGLFAIFISPTNVISKYRQFSSMPWYTGKCLRNVFRFKPSKPSFKFLICPLTTLSFSPALEDLTF